MTYFCPDCAAKLLKRLVGIKNKKKRLSKARLLGLSFSGSQEQ